MTNRTFMLEQLGTVFAEEQAEVLTEIIFNSYNDIGRREDFSELKEIVRDLAEAQKRADQRMDSLAQRMDSLAEAQKQTAQSIKSLAEAQKRTDQRMDSLAQRMESLAEAQKRADQRMDSLAQRMDSLAEAQKQTAQSIKSLAEAQKRTDQRMDSLAQRMESLAEAQKRADQRMDSLAQRMDSLAEAQKQTDQSIKSLAEAQKQTDQSIKSLAEAQKRTDQRMDSLAEAQRQTEYALQQLALQVGGLSNRMGGDLEDVAAIMIHDLLERELGWQIDELDRAWQMGDGTEEEIDVFGKAHDPSRPDTSLWIVGEVKFNLTMRDVERFALLLERASLRLEGEIVPVCFSYRVRPAVREALKQAGYRLVLSNGRMIA